MGENAVQQREMAEFLQACRRRISPRQAGLPAHGRRRTPGLRREEVAALAGVSPTWYTYLEQGRDVRASQAVLHGLARALQLTAAEGAHLFQLAGFSCATTGSGSGDDFYPAVRDLVDLLEPSPAYVVDRYWDVRVFNRSAADWLPDLDRPRGHNIFRWVMTAPSARRRLVDWADEARALLGQFRAVAARHPGDARYRALLTEAIDADPAIGAWWSSHEIQATEPGEKRVRHPTRGITTVRHMALDVAGRADLRVMVCLLPAPPVSHPPRS